MKRILSVCLLACMLFSLMAVSANADGIGDAESISIDYSYSGMLSESNNADYYRFSIPASGAVTLSANAYRMEHVTYILYDAAGNELWKTSPYWDRTTELITTKETVNLIKGSYYFVVKVYDDYGQYDFKLSFQSAEETFVETSDSMNNTIGTANAIQLDTAYKGQIAENDDKDFYCFNLKQSGKIQFAATAYKMDHISYRLYDADRNQIWSDSYYWNTTTETTNTNETFDLTAGTYYFLVQLYDYAGNYTFRMDYTNAGESFPETGNGTNNTLQTAILLALNTTYHGQLALTDEKDFYQFSLASSDTIVLQASAAMEHIYYRFYDADGNQIWSDYYYWNTTTQKSNTREEIPLEKGTYYFAACKRYDGVTGNYEFSIASSSATPPSPPPTTPPSPPPTTPPSPSPTTDPSPSPTTPPPSTSFKDVNPSSWYAPYVQWAVQKGITNGTSATTFSPNADCTRAQIVTFLWRAAGQPSVSGSSPFKDVKSGDYFYKAVLWAVSKGITNGTSATTFSPGQGCTRAQVVTFFWRASGQSAPKSNVSPFRDIRNTGAYYYSAVLWAYENNVVNGIDEGVFAPNNTCTRAQIVTILGRYYG